MALKDKIKGNKRKYYRAPEIMQTEFAVKTVYREARGGQVGSWRKVST